MPFNGSGTFQSLAPPLYPAIAGETIRASYFNSVIDDLIAGLTTTITKDGQTTPTANLPMGGKKHTNVADAVAEDEYTTLRQLSGTGSGQGTSLFGSHDAGAYYAESDAEGQLQSLGLSRKKSGRVEDWGIGADVGAVVNAMLAAGISDITCDTDCTCSTPIINTRDDVSIALRCAVTWSGSVAAGVTSSDITGVITQRGSLTGSVYVKTLSATLSEGGDTIQLDDTSMFSVGDFWNVQPTASEWGPLSFLLEVSAVNTGAHTVSFVYKAGWTVASGTSYTFQKVTPVRNAVAYIQELIYATAEGASSGVAGIGEQYTVDCISTIGKASNTKYPGILKRWFVGGVCSMRDLVAPQDITTGGMGYGIQQIHGLYGRAIDTRTSKARHVVDWSGCAYCTAVGMHGSQGLANTTDFSCHLGYDHDNTLEDFSGWLSWDNLLVFGQSAKRLKAKKGLAKGQLAWFNATSDCTFEDIHVIGDIIVNPDGATLRNVTQAGGTTRFIQSSTASVRGTTEIIGCELIPRLAGSGDWVESSVTTPLSFTGGKIGPLNNVVTRGGTVVFNNVALSSSSTPGQAHFIYSTDMQVNGGTHNYNNFRVLGTAVKLTIDGGSLQAFNDTVNGFVDGRIASGTLRVKVNDLVADLASSSCRFILWTGAGGTLNASWSGNSVNSGAVEINSSIGATGSVNGSVNTTIGTTYAVPAAGARVAYTGELRL